MAFIYRIAYLFVLLIDTWVVDRKHPKIVNDIYGV